MSAPQYEYDPANPTYAGNVGGSANINTASNQQAYSNYPGYNYGTTATAGYYQQAQPTTSTASTTTATGNTSTTQQYQQYAQYAQQYQQPTTSSTTATTTNTA